jgi:excinuclease ABC subunit B
MPTKGIREHFWGDEIEKVERFDPLTNNTLEAIDHVTIYPANIFVTSRETLNSALESIQLDLGKQVGFFGEIGKHLEAKRLEERTHYDLEMMRELGYCSGIENYSRYFDNRKAGDRPFCLIDYFPDDFLLVIDESHVTVSQVSGHVRWRPLAKEEPRGIWVPPAQRHGQQAPEVRGVRKPDGADPVRERDPCGL